MIILDAKTDYSFLRGYGTPEQWLARCKDVGVTAFGVADYCSTWGHAPFRKAFKGSGIKLLYGVQLTVTNKLERDARHSLVTLIAKSDLSALYELTRLAHVQMYYRPRLLWEQVQSFKGWAILNYVSPNHIRHAQKLSDGAFIGINAEDTPEIDTLPRVYSYGPRYPLASDRAAYDLFQNIAGMTKIGEIAYNPLHLMRAGEMARVLPDDPDATANTQRIADETTADIPKGTLISTFVPAHKKQTKIEQLRDLAFMGATKLGLWITPGTKKKAHWIDKAYGERLDRELHVIEEKKFEDYFFFVADLVNWARARMLVGPGRGSSGGSLLCFLLGITTVDPLKFGTLFERFIDITRPDWPDIDIDFPDTRREEVFKYLKDTYGADRVARLGTLTEMGGKSAFNDAGRALGVPFDVSRALGRFTEGTVQGQVFSPARVMGLDGKPPLADEDHMKLVEKWPQIKMAAAIDGHIRHHGVHAAGVVVTQEPVSRYGTVNQDGVIEMDMKSAEDIGLLKMDALGLRTLSVLQDACDLAKVNSDKLFTLDWNDHAIYDRIFAADRVTGIFQFEGHAVRSLMKGAKCERFDDICALTSLARPGPLIGGAAEQWAKCRIGQGEARDLHPALDSTYGVICYQEQAMAIVRDLAGFSEPEVNGFRRAVGKKEPEKLKAYREKFVAGATNYFYSNADHPGAHMMEQFKKRAEDLWDELCEFGSYAFNLAHAVEYAMISYMAAWMKHYHPLEFAAATLRHAADDEQGKALLRELVEEGYEFVPFDAAKSQASWAIIDGKLYGGFDSVRGIGEKTAEKLLEARNKGGENWLDDLTEAQRNRLTKDMNTPWHELRYFSQTYKALYDDPDAWRSEGITAGIKGPVLRIKDIPAEKGNYAFLGRITKKQQRDANEASKVAARGGQKHTSDTHFWNVFVEDDTGEIGCTINRFKVEKFRWLTDSVTDDRDFLFRGNIINANGSRWIFLDNVVELINAESD
jgi:DNA polymerase III alpha subunit